MSKKGTVILKKKGGLGKLHSLMRGAPKEYYQEREDREVEGKYAGAYKSPSLPGIRHYISPQFSELEGKWCWGGTMEDLERLVKELGLRYDSGKNDDELIKFSDIRLDNSKDKFFNHISLYNSKWLADGRILLNLDTPIEEFFYLVYKGWRDVHDKTQDRADIFVAGARYEIENPKIVKAKQARNVKQEMQATALLADMTRDEDFEKMRMIAEIMGLRSFSTKSSDDEIFVMLSEEAVKGEEKERRFNNKSYRERFIELGNLPDEELYVTHKIHKAKRLKILVPRNGYYLFNTGNSGLSDQLSGIVTDNQLLQYFLNPDNEVEFAELDNQLQQRKSKAQK